VVRLANHDSDRPCSHNSSPTSVGAPPLPSSVIRLIITAVVVILATALLVALWPRGRRDGEGDPGQRRRKPADGGASRRELGVGPDDAEAGAATVDPFVVDDDPFDAVRSTLVPQLVPAEEVDDDHLHFQHVAQSDLPGLVTMLTYDARGLRGRVRREESDRWLRDDAELFSIAMRNLRAHPGLPTPVPIDLESGPTVHVVQGPSRLTASMSLILADLPELIGDHGVLVAVPTQRVMLLHTLGRAPILNAIARMVPMVLHHHMQGPDALVTDLFWYRHGNFVRLPYELRDNTLSLRPPEEFVALMNRLGDSEA